MITIDAIPGEGQLMADRDRLAGELAAAREALHEVALYISGEYAAQMEKGTDNQWLTEALGLIDQAEKGARGAALARLIAATHYFLCCERHYNSLILDDEHPATSSELGQAHNKRAMALRSLLRADRAAFPEPAEAQ